MSKPITSYSDIDDLVRGEIVEFFPGTFNELPIHYVCKEIDGYGYIHLIGKRLDHELIRLTVHTRYLDVGPFETVIMRNRAPYRIFPTIPDEEILYSSVRDLHEE